MLTLLVRPEAIACGADLSFTADVFFWSVLGVDRRSRTSEQKITSGRSPLYLITFNTLLM